MPDQGAKFFERIECRAGAIGIGLKNAGNNALAREPGDGAMTMHGAQHFEAADVARFARITKADVFGALHVRSDQRRQRARRGTDKTIPNRRRLSK